MPDMLLAIRSLGVGRRTLPGLRHNLLLEQRRWDAHRDASLTIMFSKAYLASQQFRKTGMNKFRRGGQNIYKRKLTGKGLRKIRVLYQKQNQL